MDVSVVGMLGRSSRDASSGLDRLKCTELGLVIPASLTPHDDADNNAVPTVKPL